MKKFSKKLIAMLLLIIMGTSSISTPCFAKTDNNPNLNAKQKKLMEDSNIDLSTIEVLDKNQIFSTEILKKFEKEDQELASKGLVKEAEVYYIKKNQMTLMSSPYDMILFRVTQLTTPTEEKSGTTTGGMAALLDIVWNLTIGSKTKYFWKVATVLSLNPSNFMTSYSVGDSLRETKTYVYNDKLYCFFDSNSNYWPLVRTTNLNVTIYEDLYTTNVYGYPVRTSNSTNASFYTYHYYNTTWINSECAVNRLYNGSAVTYDYYE